MANIYKSKYTGAQVDDAIEKVLKAAPESGNELQKKLKEGTNITIATDGTISATNPIAATATDDDVVVLTGSGGTNSVSYDAKHAKKGPANGYTSENTTTSISGSGGTIKIPQITVDNYGHVTAAADEDVTITMPDAGANYSVVELTNNQTTLTQEQYNTLIASPFNKIKYSDHLYILYSETTTSDYLVYTTNYLNYSNCIRISKSTKAITKENVTSLTVNNYSVMNYIGAKDKSSNAATENGNTYLKLYTNGKKKSQFNIKGEGATTITSDKSGNITITSTDTKVTSVDNHYTPTANTASQINKDASSTTEATWGTTSLVTGVNIQRDAKGHVTGMTLDSIKMPAKPEGGNNELKIFHTSQFFTNTPIIGQTPSPTKYVDFSKLIDKPGDYTFQGTELLIDSFGALYRIEKNSSTGISLFQPYCVAKNIGNNGFFPYNAVITDSPSVGTTYTYTDSNTIYPAGCCLHNGQMIIDNSGVIYTVIVLDASNTRTCKCVHVPSKVVQTGGQSTTTVMSQKAVTDAIANTVTSLGGKTGAITLGSGLSISSDNVLSSTGGGGSSSSSIEIIDLGSIGSFPASGSLTTEQLNKFISWGNNGINAVKIYDQTESCGTMPIMVLNGDYQNRGFYYTGIWGDNKYSVNVDLGDYLNSSPSSGTYYITKSSLSGGSSSGDNEQKAYLGASFQFSQMIGQTSYVSTNVDSSVAGLTDAEITGLIFDCTYMDNPSSATSTSYSYQIRLNDLYRMFTTDSMGIKSASLTLFDQKFSLVFSDISTNYSQGTVNYNIPLTITPSLITSTDYLSMNIGFTYKGFKFANGGTY